MNNEAAITMKLSYIEMFSFSKVFEYHKISFVHLGAKSFAEQDINKFPTMRGNGHFPICHFNRILWIFSHSGCELSRWDKTRGHNRAFALEIRFGAAWVGCVYHSADQIRFPAPPPEPFSDLPSNIGPCGANCGCRQTRSALCELETSTTIAICLHLLGTSLLLRTDLAKSYGAAGTYKSVERKPRRRGNLIKDIAKIGLISGPA